MGQAPAAPAKMMSATPRGPVYVSACTGRTSPGPGPDG